MRSAWISVAVLGALLACSSTEPSPGGALPPSDVGRRCARTSDCESGLCVPVQTPFEGQPVTNVCTRACKANDDCLSGWSCRVGPSGVDVCQCTRREEVCDGRDNDCDGIVDNDSKGLCATCTLTVCGDQCVDTRGDPNNCGACGRSCGPNSVCAGGECRCVISNAACDPSKRDRFCGAEGVCHEDVYLGGGISGVAPSATTSIAVGASFVLYALSEPGGSAGYNWLFQSSLEPAPTSKQLAAMSGGQLPGSAADGADFAYAYFRLTGPATMEGTLVPCPGGACGPHLLRGVDVVSNRLQLSGGKVYWMKDGALRRCALSGCGGTPENLGPLPSAFGGPFVVDASGVYGIFSGTVAKWTDGTGAFTPLFTANAQSIALDDASVFVTTDSGIVTCAKSGCGATPTPFAAVASAKGLAVLGAHVHWVSGESLFRCPKAGVCVPQRIAGGFPPIGAENATHLFFPAHQAVRKVSK